MRIKVPTCLSSSLARMCVRSEDLAMLLIALLADHGTISATSVLSARYRAV